LAFLGYYTDNGAYYYERVDKNYGLQKMQWFSYLSHTNYLGNYYNTLIALKEQFKKQNLPIQYVQYDSWFVLLLLLFLLKCAILKFKIFCRWYRWGPDRGVDQWLPRDDSMTFPNGRVPDLNMPQGCCEENLKFF
jgi:hypothetical protein